MKPSIKRVNAKDFRSNWVKGPVGTKKDMIQDKQIISIQRKIKKIEYNEEVKYIDGPGSATIPETGLQLIGGAFPAAIQQGIASNQRIGQEIVTTSLLLRASISTAGNKLTPTRVRCIVYWDSQANGAVNVTSGTAQSLMEASATVDGTLDFRNQETIDRFTILMDKVYVLNPQQDLTTVAGVVTVNQPVTIYISKRFRLGRKIQYSASTGTVTDLAKNNICVVFISDNNTDPPTCLSNIRLYYKDT